MMSNWSRLALTFENISAGEPTFVTLTLMPVCSS